MNTSTVTRFRLRLFVQTRKPLWDLNPTGIEIKNDLELSIAYAVIERKMLGTLGTRSYFFGSYDLIEQDPGQLVAVSAYISSVSPKVQLAPNLEVIKEHRVRRVQVDFGGFVTLKQAVLARRALVLKKDWGVSGSVDHLRFSGETELLSKAELLELEELYGIGPAPLMPYKVWTKGPGTSSR